MMTSPSAPRLGFCCKFVPPDGDKAETKRMNLTSTTIAALGRKERAAVVERLLEIVGHNMEALEAQLRWIAGRPPIERLLRLASNVLPAYTHESTAWVYREPAMRELAERGLARCGEIARAAGIRLSMHPGPFCILGTLSDSALENAVGDFEYHTDVMRMLGLAGGWHPAGTHINIHVGSRAAGTATFRRNLRRLSGDARRLITVENDEDVFGLDDLLPLADELPVVLDFYHHWIRTGGRYVEPDDPCVRLVEASWRGVRPVAHVSAPREDLPGSPYPPDILPDFQALVAGGVPRRELYAHSDLMWNDALNDWIAGHLAWTDIEVEAKLKNLASARLAEAAARRAAPLLAVA